MGMMFYDEGIDVIAAFEKDKSMPLPIKFKLNGKLLTIHDIINTDVEKICGIKVYSYKCKTLIDNREIFYELKYEVLECKWRVYKMQI